MQESDMHTSTKEHGNGTFRTDDLVIFDDDKTTISSSNDSGHITFDIHRPRHRTLSLHDKLV